MTETETYAPPPMFPAGRAVIFGGSGGIGRAVARALVAHGSPVALSYRNGREKAETIAEQLRRQGGDVTIGRADIQDAASVAGFLEAAARGCKIHSVIFATGPELYFDFVSTVRADAFRQFMEADVYGFMNIAQASLPYLRDGGGSITAVVTCGVRQWLMRDVLSIVPKTAVWSIVQGLSKEEGRYGVRANAVGVGVTDVGMGEREMQHSGESMQDFFERILKQIPLRRIGHADQIAETVAFMASQRASYVTGQLINVDGGLAG